MLYAKQMATLDPRLVNVAADIAAELISEDEALATQYGVIRRLRALSYAECKF